MREDESTTRAYQEVLKNWVFEKPSSFSEDFAQKRFLKKFQEPCRGNDQSLAQKAWDDFITFDNTLPSESNLLSGEWYKARLRLHSLCRGRPERSPVDFPKGSSVFPTFGLNSIESRLARGQWTCTPENFNEFSRLVYNHKALKRAFRRRYTRWYQRSKFEESFKESNIILWNGFKHLPDPGFSIFKWKLEQITQFVRGSRFSTVPKNNTTRRPINIEPLGNILNQRQLGNFLRDRLRTCEGQDLDTLADTHASMIKDHRYATIDLKNASDSVSIALVRFLFPDNFYQKLLRSRSPMLYGSDKNYHITKKISSMGNGFTFELMTVILTSVARTLDETASVFGDDIIIKADVASRLIHLLEEVGFVVNKEKSFIEGPFRESCGANHHETEGYIKSFDFLWPSVNADCATLLAKAYALREYPSFNSLFIQLYKRTPKALRGGTFDGSLVDRPWDSPRLTTWFITDLKNLPYPSKKVRRKIQDAYCVKDVRVGFEYHFVNEEASPTLSKLSSKHHWAKYEMYLFSGMRSKDSKSGAGRWAKRTIYFLDGLITRFDKKILSELLGQKEKK